MLLEFLSADLVRELLFNLIGGGLSGLIAYWFLGTPVGKRWTLWVTSLLKNLFNVGKHETTRLLALFVSGLLQLLAFLVAGLPFLGYLQYPQDLAGWLNLIITVFTVAFTGSQLIHGRKELDK